MRRALFRRAPPKSTWIWLGVLGAAEAAAMILDRVSQDSGCLGLALQALAVSAGLATRSFSGSARRAARARAAHTGGKPADDDRTLLVLTLE